MFLVSCEMHANKGEEKEETGIQSALPFVLFSYVAMHFVSAIHLCSHVVIFHWLIYCLFL